MFIFIHAKKESSLDDLSGNFNTVLTGRFGLRGCRSWRGTAAAAAAHRLLPLVPEDIFDRQPLTDSDGRFTLVGDFRLNDRPDLEATLGLNRERAARLADSDLVLAAWRRWSDAAPEHLAGDFAFAIHDRDARTTHLVVDHLGNNSLYYARTVNGLLAASSRSTLLAMSAVDRELDLRYLAGFLINDPSLAERTPFKNIHRLPHGTIMRFNQTGLERKWRYWDFDPSRRVTLAKDQDYVEQARELLDRSVRNNARLCGPLIGTLTAGFDSAAVIGTLAKVVPGKDIQTFTLAPPEGATGFTGRGVDESAHAARTAAHWPAVRHDVLRVPERQAKMWENPEEWFAASASPMRNWKVLSWYDALWAEARRRGASAVFTARSGNSGLSYDGLRALSNWIRQGRILKVANETRLISRNAGEFSPGVARILWRQGIRPMAPGWFARGLDYWRGHKSWPPALRDSLLSRQYFFNQDIGGDIQAMLGNPHRDHTADAFTLRSVWFSGGRYRSSDRRDANRIRSGITNLDPLGDRHLMEFCLALPLDQYLRDGQSRFLARRVLADRLPASTFEPVPPIYQGGDSIDALNTHKDLFASIVEDVVKSSTAREILDLPELRRLIHDWPDDDAWRRGDVDPRVNLQLARALHIGQFIRWTERSNQ